MIELILSMAIFSFILLIFLNGFIHLTRQYRAAIQSRKSQEAARFAIEQIVRDSRSASVADVIANGACFYTVSEVQKYQVDSVGGTGVLNRYDYVRRPGLACAGYTGGTAKPLTPSDVNVVSFAANLITGVLPDGSQQQSARLTLRILSTSDASLITGSGSTANCRTEAANLQYCAVAQFTSSVSLRGAF